MLSIISTATLGTSINIINKEKVKKEMEEYRKKELEKYINKK